MVEHMKIPDSRAQRTVGRFYMVEAVRVIDWHGFHGIWLPIIGPKHEDADVIGFDAVHWHVDWRFASQRVVDRILSIPTSRGTSSVYAWPVSDPDGWNRKAIDQGPELRRMKCKREWPAMPWEKLNRAWLPKLAAKYACARLKNGKCPHRGIPVSEMKREGDILICPAHALKWSAITGEAVP